MLDGDSLLEQRFKDKRPGLSLVAIENAALPVTVLSATVIAQERKPLPLLDEFVLRLVAAGVDTVTGLASSLGLDRPLVSDALADQISAGTLAYSATGERLALSEQGKRTVEVLEAVQPVERRLPLAFDRLTWALAPFAENQLIQKRDANEAGMIILPAKKTSHISGEDVTAPGINALLIGRTPQKSMVEVLDVKRVRALKHRYLPVKLLIFGDVERREVQVGFCVEGDLSEMHELALNELGGADVLGITVAPPGPRPVLEGALESARVTSAEVIPLRDDTVSARLTAAKAEPAQAVVPDAVNAAEEALGAMAVRGVGVFEHRELLGEALSSARTRLLLISPWVRSAVVDTNFVAQLEQRIRSGTVVHIAHGIGADDSGSDQAAIERLSNLQRRFADRFVFARLANTHAKILIFDDKWISTSFNWLSFRGDPNRTYRMEEGTLVQLPERVTAEYERYVDLIESQRIG